MMKTYILGKTYFESNTKLPEIGDMIKLEHKNLRCLVFSISNNGILANMCKSQLTVGSLALHTTELFDEKVFRITFAIKNGKLKLVPKNFRDIILDNESIYNQYAPTSGFASYFNFTTLYNKPSYNCSYIRFLKAIKQKPRTRAELRILGWTSACLFNRLSTLLLIDGYYYNGQKYFVPGPAFEAYCNKYGLNL